MRVAVGSLNADAPNGVDSGSVLLAMFVQLALPSYLWSRHMLPFLAFVIISLSSQFISGVAVITVLLGIHVCWWPQI